VTGSRAVASRAPLMLVFAALWAGGCVGPTPREPDPRLPPPRIALPVRPGTVDPTGFGIILPGTPAQGALLSGQVTGSPRLLTLDGVPVRVAPDGRFIIGFGRDAPSAALLRAVYPDGSVLERPLTVVPRQWPTEVVASVPRRPLPDADYERIRATEIERINAARRLDNVSDGWRQRFVWPATGRISGVFGSQRVYKGGERGDPHSGVDVAIPTGTPVLAPADGVVILAADRPFTLEGNLLMIDHGMGLNSAFLHLSRIDVKVGDVVRQGQAVALSGATGRASGPHLHWAMKWQDRRVDPATVAGAMP